MFITKWADVLRRAHEATIEDVDFVEKEWNKGLKKLVEEHGARYDTKGPKIITW